MTTKTKQPAGAPAAEPLAARISVASTSPLNFFNSLKDAFAHGYEFDPMGFAVLTPSYLLVEMALPGDAQ
jgi:hypothetical protein